MELSHNNFVVDNLNIVTATNMWNVQYQPKISKRDRELIEGVRAYLTKTFLEAHTMNSLAREFGTNTHKLMTLFKKTFDTSIFDYLNTLKMDHAKRMLEEQGCYVSEVARELGYKNPHHFTAAFKRRFGICPSKLKSA
jgi:AraC-like DNA-binding protein